MWLRWNAGRPSFEGRHVRYLGPIVWAAILTLLALRLLASLDGIDAGLTVSPDRSYVSGVRVGSVAWTLGVEPGDGYVRSPMNGGGLILGSEPELGLADELPPREWWPIASVILLLVSAIVVRRWAPTLASVLVVAASALLAWELLGVVVMPLALAVVLVPTLVVGIRWIMGASGRRHRGALAAVTVAAIALEVGALATATKGTWRGIWAVASLAPVVVAVGVAALT